MTMTANRIRFLIRETEDMIRRLDFLANVRQGSEVGSLCIFDPLLEFGYSPLSFYSEQVVFSIFVVSMGGCFVLFCFNLF